MPCWTAASSSAGAGGMCRCRLARSGRGSARVQRSVAGPGRCDGQGQRQVLPGGVGQRPARCSAEIWPVAGEGACSQAPVLSAHSDVSMTGWSAVREPHLGVGPESATCRQSRRPPFYEVPARRLDKSPASRRSDSRCPVTRRTSVVRLAFRSLDCGATRRRAIGASAPS